MTPAEIYMIASAAAMLIMLVIIDQQSKKIESLMNTCKLTETALNAAVRGAINKDKTIRELKSKIKRLTTG